MNLLPPLRKTLVFLHKNAHLISAAMKKFYILWLNAMVVKKVVFYCNKKGKKANLLMAKLAFWWKYRMNVRSSEKIREELKLKC